MHKVVVERPRWNPGPGKQHRRANLSDELLPRYEGIRRPHTNRKCFTDLLGPLRRWLHAQMGRPWDDVYSEACAVITADSVVRALGLLRPEAPDLPRRAEGTRPIQRAERQLLRAVLV